MPNDRDTIREGDIEPISRRLTREGRGMKDRLLIDKAGRRVLYSTDRKGKVTIKEYQE